MVLDTYAGVAVDDIEAARAWYATVFGREPDAAPMGGLYEWHSGEHCMQLVALATIREIQGLPHWGAAGSSSVTLVVDDANAVAQRALGAGGVAVSHFDGPAFQTTSIRDPEGNLVTLLKPTPA
jgi:predicted enzyme related to lactoylglutathione lyase